MTPEFVPFPKIGRWSNSKIAITEKIDGTNGVIGIEKILMAEPDGVPAFLDAASTDPTILFVGIQLQGSENPYVLVVRAGSRNRWLTRQTDNFGFAKWVQENASELVKLGPGTHYGEWWGNGIQRGYDMPLGVKRFSLFNVGRWVDTINGVYDKSPVPNISEQREKKPIVVPGLTVVPLLFYGGARDGAGNCMIAEAMRRLAFSGSDAMPGFKGPGKAGPEGVMVYFEALKSYAKAPFDEAPKGQG